MSIESAIERLAAAIEKHAEAQLELAKATSLQQYYKPVVSPAEVVGPSTPETELEPGPETGPEPTPTEEESVVKSDTALGPEPSAPVPEAESASKPKPKPKAKYTQDFDISDVKKSLTRLIDTKGEKAAINFMAGFGCERLSELNESQYMEVIMKADEASRS